MALLESNEIILRAQLTRRGRELIFGQNERFIVTKFSLGDGEVNYNLPNQNDIESLTVFEPSTNPSALSSRLIRIADNVESVIQKTDFIATTELQVKTQVVGSTVFSLQNWNVDEPTISFALLDPNDNSYFLSSGFLVDMSNFYNKYVLNDTKEGIGFNFNPVFPSATLGMSNAYWYNTTNTYTTKSGMILPVIVGIDDSHRKTPEDTPLANLTNDLNIPILTFKLKLIESQVRDIYMYLLNNNLSSITDNIVIRNNDKTVVPITDFYGAGKSYQSISASIPFTITF